jgi:hypothetical protein
MTARSLPPDAPFPADLTKLSDLRLHVLNSLLHRRLDLEYQRAGSPDPETEFRVDEIRQELDRRDADELLCRAANGHHAGAPVCGGQSRCPGAEDRGLDELNLCFHDAVSPDMRGEPRCL